MKRRQSSAHSSTPGPGVADSSPSLRDGPVRHSGPANGRAKTLLALGGGAGAYAIGAAFLLLAVWFIMGPDGLDLPHTQPVSVPRDQFSSEPLRAPPSDPPFIWRGGYELACMECHRLLPAPSEPRALLTQHTEIVLDHGLNDRCYNCHDRFNRNRLALPGGGTISFAETPRLCATCHGPTYRDWELGIHGRTAGSWQVDGDAQSRLACTQCHNPHAPAFAPMSLLPGPNTIRMGARPDHGHTPDYTKGSPLKRWKIALKGKSKAGYANNGHDGEHAEAEDDH